MRLADVQGKETGIHKCDNLRAQIAAYAAVHGRRPRVWFVEDRLETLEHVTAHPDLGDVGLFLAAWGYNTPQTRAAAGRNEPGAAPRAESVQARSRRLAVTSASAPKPAHRIDYLVADGAEPCDKLLFQPEPP